MQLTTTGAIKIDGHLARFTDDGKWMVSRSGTVLGYVDMVDDIVPLIEKNRERVRARLAFVQRKADERKAEERMPPISSQLPRGSTHRGGVVIHPAHSAMPALL